MFERASLTHINLFDRTSASASPLSESRSFTHFISQPVNRSRTYAQRLREIGLLRCQSAFHFLFIVLENDFRERASIIAQTADELISFPERPATGIRAAARLNDAPMNRIIRA